MNAEIAKVILQFLDRCPIKGHEEVTAFNVVREALSDIISPPAMDKEDDGRAEKKVKTSK